MSRSGSKPKEAPASPPENPVGTAALVVPLRNAVGLHARPAVKLTQLAARFAATIELRVGEEGDWVDAKSIVRVMGLKARTGTVLQLRAVGADAAEALGNIEKLVLGDFEQTS
ncbi:MAG: HPr family phosphocarrier protein [Proteobacteria bacterium]|nr:HPr family phosphocarrier protein [Pseudomonadota bacterium]MBI3499976.1 HPr family phosphocarrier protein [Pseudomonadota bacterium]